MFDVDLRDFMGVPLISGNIKNGDISGTYLWCSKRGWLENPWTSHPEGKSHETYDQKYPIISSLYPYKLFNYIPLY